MASLETSSPQLEAEHALRVETEHRLKYIVAVLMALSCASGAVIAVPTIIETVIGGHIAAAIVSSGWAEAIMAVGGGIVGTITAMLRRA